jgi:hypothetical protein
MGSVSVDGWHLLLLEDLRNDKKVRLGPRHWLCKRFEKLQHFTCGDSESSKVEAMASEGVTDNWLNIKNNSDERNYFLGLFQGNRNEAEA